MATPTPEDIINLLLVGKTGVGKSSTGNSIVQLQTKPFKAGPTTGSITKKCQFEYARVMERKLKVVDGPGLADTEMSDEEAINSVIEETKRAVAITPDGYDAILVVITFGRLSKDDKKSIEQLKGIFGENFIAEYGVLVVTYGDQYDPDEYDGQTFEQWCMKQTGVFQELLQECHGRIVVFDNKSKDKTVKESQIKRLFQVVDKMKYGPRRYTPRIFKTAQAERDRLLLDAKEPVVREETENQTRLIMHELDEIMFDVPEEDIQKLREIQQRVDKLLNETREQDKGTCALKSVLQLIESVGHAVKEKLLMAQTIIKNNQRDRDMDEKFATMEAGHEKERNEWRKEQEENNLRIEEMKKSAEKSRKEMEDKYQNLLAQCKREDKIIGYLEKATAVVDLLGGLATLASGITNAVKGGVKTHKMTTGK